MMMGKIYVPCLRFKQGEYLALKKLSVEAKNYIMPLLEVAEIGFDFENQTESKTIDEHLKKLAKRVKENWGIDECFVDLRLIDGNERMVSGEHPVIFTFNDLRLKNVNAIPVIGLDADTSFRKAVTQTIKFDGRGLCIRTNLDETSGSNFAEMLENLISELHINPENCDFILDLNAPPNFEPLNTFANLLQYIIADLPHLNEWRSFGIIGTSFPPSLSGINSGVSYLPRNEWFLYKELVKKLKELGMRIPTFGDYVINNPEILKMDMRLIKPKANIRYALDDRWLIARGETIRDHGLGQYKKLCGLIIASQDFYGASFSIDDKYIYDCAKGVVSTGNPTTWRRVGTNHHLEVVARAVANFAGS